MIQLVVVGCADSKEIVFPLDNRTADHEKQCYKRCVDSLKLEEVDAIRFVIQIWPN